MSRRKHSGVLPSIQAAGRGIVIKIEGDGASANKALELVQEHLRETQHEAGAAGEAIERMKGALETVGLYMGVRELIDGLKELTIGSLELGESLEKASKKSGLAVESLSVLHYAAGVTGSDFDGLVSSLSKMENTIAKAADGDQKSAAFIKALGLNAKELTERADGAEVAFHKFLQTLAATENPLERNRLAMGLLGKAGAQQIPVLLELAENWDFFKQKAQAAGVLLTADTAAALASTNQRLNDMKERFIGVGVSLTEGLSPALNEMFGIMSDGRGQMDTFKSWGDNIGRVLAFIAEAATTAAAGIELAFSALEGGKLTAVGAKDYAEANRLYDEAKRYYAIAQGKASGTAQTPFIPKPGEGPKGPGFEGAPVAGKVKSGNPIAEAQAQLDQEQAKAAADLRKSQDQIQLAELEAQHKELLISDQAFYDEKLRLQLDELDAEKDALTKRGATLQGLYDKQHGDKLLKRDKRGNSAEELKTQRELLQISEQIDALGARRGQATSQHDSETVLSQREQELATLKIAAELEKQRGTAIAAQIALIEREHELEAQKFERNGDNQGAADARAAGLVLEQKLRAADIEQQIGETEQSYKLQAEAIEQRAAKGRESKLDAEHELNALHLQEAASLKALVDQYDALAATLGGPFKQKAAELHAELDSLGTPDRKVEAEFGKKLADGFGGMVTSITEKAAEGKESVAKMAQDILHDVENLAIKLAEQKFILPLFENAFGAAPSAGGAAAGAGGSWLSKLLGGGGGGATGGGGGAVAQAPASLASPSIFTPAKQGGGSSFGSIATDIAKAGATALTPKVTSNVINQSSQPVSSSAPEVSYDSELREFVIHTILTDHSEGGAISQIMGGS